MENEPNIQVIRDSQVELNMGCSCGGTCGNLSIEICHPNGKLHRFVVLVCMCIVCFGSFSYYETPSALQEKLQKELNITVSQYSLLFSIYAWPNVILCGLGGFLIDRVFGLRLGANLCMGSTLIGQLIFSVGVYVNIFWLTLAGRFVFGVGIEALYITQFKYAVRWFKGKELNMVFGLLISCGRVGTIINFLITDWIYDLASKTHQGTECLGIVLFGVSTPCLLSMVCCVILGFLDRRAELIVKRTDNGVSDRTSIKLVDVKYFKATFWLSVAVSTIYMGTTFSFIALVKVFIMEKFDKNSNVANTITSSFYIITGIAGPIVGILIDKTGYNLFWLASSFVCTILPHILLAFTSFEPYVGMVALGLSFAIFSTSFWPLMSFDIPEYLLGTAYGVCQGIQNLGLAVVAIGTGKLQEDYGHMGLEISVIIILSIGFLLSILLWKADKCRGGVLNMTSEVRRQHKRRALSTQATENAKLVTAKIATISTC